VENEKYFFIINKLNILCFLRKNNLDYLKIKNKLNIEKFINKNFDCCNYFDK